MPDTEDHCAKYGCMWGCGIGIPIFVLIIVVSSLSQVQFNEYAFRKPWGQQIDQTKVYHQGVHMMGFWTSLVIFPADIVDLQLTDLEVFSSNSGDDAGTTLEIDVGVQYKLDPEFLSDLFDIGGEKGYINQIRAEVIQIVKNTATQFNADSYLTFRREIEKEFQRVVTEEIKNNFANTQVVNFQLLRVPFPEAFYARKLDVGLQALRNEIENFTRITTQVRDSTARKVLVIENDAKRIVDTAKADASLIVARANNDFERLVGTAKEEGMRVLATQLGITTQADFLSLNYLVQLLNNKGRQKKFVNFGDLPPAVSLV